MSLPNFVLDNSYEFDWPVKAQVPIAGKHKTFGFTARFRHVEPERRLEILEEHRRRAMARNERLLDVSGDLDDDAEAAEDDNPTFEQDLLTEVLVGFSGILDKDKNPVEFNDDSRDALLRNDFARNALLKAYMAALNGRAPEKNSSRRPRRGQND